MKNPVILLIAFLVAAFLDVRPAHSDTVSQLNLTSESFSLNLGTSGSISGPLNQTGSLTMGQFQAAPSILPVTPLQGQMLSFFTNSSSGFFSAPSGQTAGTSLTVDLSSLFVGVTGPQINGTFNVGGLATGTYDPTTGQFSLSWTHTFTDITSSNMTIAGTTAVVPTPLPSSRVLLSLTAGLFWFLVRLGKRRPRPI